MKTLDTIMSSLSWALFGTVLWAVLPLLFKLFELARKVHEML